MSSENTRSGNTLSKRIAGQGGLLLLGFSMAQALSFARNALLGHHLSQGDFGIAAALTLTLQLVETLSDIGPERLILQAPDGGDSKLLEAGHAILLMRGGIIAATLLVAAPLSAHFFHLDAHLQLFASIALIPLIKGLSHLDQRRQQKALNNRPHLLAEVVSQIFAFAALLLLLRWPSSPWAVFWTALVQAVSATLLSHVLPRTPWRVRFDRELLKRYLTFGWPIWLSAFPLVCVYQADRMMIGHVLGMTALASYSAAFMVTMVPSLIVGKLTQALTLPLLSERQDRRPDFFAAYQLSIEVAVLLSAIYLVAFVIAGASALELAFGANYKGLSVLIGWLSLMWAVRMLQSPPGLALMAVGQTRPLLIAGLLRATTLPLAVACLYAGAPVEAVAAAGVGGELLSLFYIALTLRNIDRSLVQVTLTRSMLLISALIGAQAVTHALPATLGTISIVTIGCSAAMAFGIGLIAVLPSTRLFCRDAVRPTNPHRVTT